MVKTQYHVNIEQWMSDNGGEYVDKEYEAILKDHRIRIDRSVPHQPQMNGRAERFNRTIDEKSEAMQHYACLPDNWWEFSVIHANYLYNRTPVCCLNWKSLWEMISGNKPDLTHLRVFGCGAYVLLPQAVQKNKLLPKSEVMTFLGYETATAKNMLFMRSPNNVLFHAATALFDEHLFPKCDKKHIVPSVTRLQERTEEPVLEVGFDNSESDSDQDRRRPTRYIPSNDREHDHDSDQAPSRPITPPAPPPPSSPAGTSGGAGEEPRQSGHTRTFPKRDGNVYPPGTMKDTNRRHKLDILGSGPDLSIQATGSGSSDEYPDLAKLATEGGAHWFVYLISKAISDGALPDSLDVCDWTIKDLNRLPADEKQAWTKAQLEELEALNRHNVYELADLPPGRKVIKN